MTRYRIPQAAPVRDSWRDHLRDAGEIVAGVLLMGLWLFLLAAVVPILLGGAK